MKADYSVGFKQFWKLYPRKKCKHVAWVVWKKVVKPLFEQDVVDALQAQLDARMFSDEVHFIPHGRTWLNQRRWEDEIEPRESKAGLAAPEKGKYDEFS